MGISDWFGGARCAECGSRIQGQKIARTVMGTSVWVCETCEEKSRAARRTERDAAAEKKLQQTATAIARRSDADIAEAMSMIALKEYGAFCKEAPVAAGRTVEIQHGAAFTYALAVSAYGFRGFLLPQLGNDRLQRIEELLTRYAFAGLIHGIVRNLTEQPKDAAPLDRGKMLSSCCEGYRQVAKIHQRNLEMLLDMGEQGIVTYFAKLSGDWFGKDFVDALRSADKSRAVRLTQCAAEVWRRGLSVAALLEPQLATIATPGKTKIEIDLPDSWRFRGVDPDRYYDPSMPQYNLLVTASVYSRSGDVPTLDTARGFLRVLSPGAEPVPLSSERAVARYRLDTPDNGQQKDEQNWILVERGDRHIWFALFTLSVLVTRADSAATEAVAEMLNDRIQRARFTEEIHLAS